MTTHILDAFEELLTKCNLNHISKTSKQYIDMKRMFYAGGIFIYHSIIPEDNVTDDEAMAHMEELEFENFVAGVEDGHS